MQDWATLGLAVNYIKKGQREEEERAIEKQAEQLAMQLRENPDLDLSAYDPKAARMALGYYHKMKGDELALDVNEMKKNIAQLEYKRKNLMDQYVKAKSLLEAGQTEQAKDMYKRVVNQIYNQFPNPFKAEVQGNKVKIYNITDPEKKPLQEINISEIPIEKLDEMILNNLAPENYIKNALAFRGFAQEYNIKSLGNAKIYRNKRTGELMYLAPTIDWRKSDKPIWVGFKDLLMKDAIKLDDINWKDWEPAGTVEKYKTKTGTSATEAPAGAITSKSIVTLPDGTKMEYKLARNVLTDLGKMLKLPTTEPPLDVEDINEFLSSTRFQSNVEQVRRLLESKDTPEPVRRMAQRYFDIAQAIGYLAPTSERPKLSTPTPEKRKDLEDIFKNVTKIYDFDRQRGITQVK